MLFGQQTHWGDQAAELTALRRLLGLSSSEFVQNLPPYSMHTTQHEPRLLELYDHLFVFHVLDDIIGVLLAT